MVITIETVPESPLGAMKLKLEAELLNSGMITPPTVTVEPARFEPWIVIVLPPVGLVTRGVIDPTIGVLGMVFEPPWFCTGAAAAIVMASVLTAVADSESVTSKSTLLLAAAVGVPETTPVWVFSVSPAGRVVAFAKAQELYVPEPPLAVSVSVYACPTVPFAKALFVIASWVVKVEVAPHA